MTALVALAQKLPAGQRPSLAAFAALPYSEAIGASLPSGDALWGASAAELAIKVGCTFIDDAEIYGYEPPPGVLPGVMAAVEAAGL